MMDGHVRMVAEHVVEEGGLVVTATQIHTVKVDAACETTPSLAESPAESDQEEEVSEGSDGEEQREAVREGSSETSEEAIPIGDLLDLMEVF
jgi:hypothetical protein